MKNVILSRDRIAQQAAVLKALGHPSRLLMVQALCNGPLCVCDLTEQVGSEMSTVSRHLSQLKNVGLLTDRREGTTVYYELRTPCILQFLHCIDGVIDGETETCCR